MKNRIALISILLVTVVLASLAFAQTKGPGFSGTADQQANWYSNSYAMVVGINSYSQGWGKLSAGMSDAKKMAQTLRSRGFTVVELFDAQATGANIVATLRKVARKTSPNDRFVFYYSGHGYTETSAWDSSQTGYLVPANSKSGDLTGYISMNQVRDEIISHCKARHVLLIVDSCFSGTLLTRGSMTDGAVSDYLSKRGIYGITAGMQDQPALDGLFTNVLLEGLGGNADYDNNGYVTFKELGLYSEQNVKARNSAQTPDYGVMYGAGQFVFAKATSQIANDPKKESSKLTIDDLPFPSEPGPDVFPEYTHRIVKISGHFQVTSCGSIVDTKTELEWYVGPSKGVTWSKASLWANSLNACGVNWRLPTVAELQTLYTEENDKLNIDKVFKTKGKYAWSSEKVGMTLANVVNLKSLMPVALPRIGTTQRCVFAVRNHK